MSCTKRFLVILGVAYLVCGVVLIITLGPPGLTRKYRDTYKDDHERYLEVSKSDAYKLYAELRPLAQREGLPQENVIEKVYREHPGLALPQSALAAGIAFVDEYTQRPEYVQEQRRMAWFGALFDWLNTLTVLALILRFAPKPLFAMLDAKIASLQKRIDASAKARADATARKTAAQAQVDGLDEDKERLEEEGEALLARVLGDIHEEAGEAIEQIARDGASRKQEEEHRAFLHVKEDLVEKTLDLVAKRYREGLTPESEAARLDRFLNVLEKAE